MCLKKLATLYPRLSHHYQTMLFIYLSIHMTCVISPYLLETYTSIGSPLKIGTPFIPQNRYPICLRRWGIGSRWYFCLLGQYDRDQFQGRKSSIAIRLCLQEREGMEGSISWTFQFGYQNGCFPRVSIQHPLGFSDSMRRSQGRAKPLKMNRWKRISLPVRIFIGATLW